MMIPAAGGDFRDMAGHGQFTVEENSKLRTTSENWTSELQNCSERCWTGILGRVLRVPNQMKSVFDEFS